VSGWQANEDRMAGVALAAIYEIYEALNASSISIRQLGRREYALVTRVGGGASCTARPNEVG